MDKVEEIVSRYYAVIRLKPLPGFRKRSIEVITELLENGVQAPKIEKAIGYYIENYTKFSDKPYISLNAVFSIDEIQSILGTNNTDSNNLIDSARFYYHKRLRLLPKPPKMIVDEDGNATTYIEPFFLEMINRFTIEDLLEYFYNIHQVDKLSRKPNRDIGAIKHIVETYRDCSIEANWLDLVLYMIDVSRQVIIDEDLRPMNNVLHIQDYELQALDLLEDKMNFERVNGVDKIVPRQTMDSGDGWTK